MPDADHVAGLVAAAQAGDQQALNDLLREHQPRMWAVCRRIVGSDADAQDALQEALIAVARHITRFDGKAAFSTWVYRIATNASLDELRRRGRRPIGVEGFLSSGDLPGTSVVGGTRSHGNDFESSIAERMRVDVALAQLPVEFRVAVTLRDLCDLDYSEIAEVLGIPAGTVRSRIARARAALALTLAAESTPSEALSKSGTNSTSNNVQGVEGKLP